MNLELNLRFPTPEQVIVRLDDDGDHDESEPLPFRGPLTEPDQQDLQWYLEVYAAQYAADVDDERAQRIAAKLPSWGAALLAAVLGDDVKARRLFDRFLDRREPGRLLTVSSDHPAVLAQPWELLRDPAGTYLVHEQPRISVRRRLPKTGGGRTPLKVNPKDRLRLLFVVSRPKEAGFIDPRADALWYWMRWTPKRRGGWRWNSCGRRRCRRWWSGWRIPPCRRWIFCISTGTGYSTRTANWPTRRNRQCCRAA
jgi:hypothetical protein